MTKPVKIITVFLWIICAAAMIGVVTKMMLDRDNQAQAVVVQSPAPNSLPVAFAAPDFSLTDQLGRTVTLADLKGHPFIVSFIFTTCATDCPTVTLKFSQLQSRIPSEIRFVSISVDPDHDTPPVLLKYAALYYADNDRWRFLTGPRDKVYDTIRGFKVGATPMANNQISHDLNYNLFDSQGHYRGHYNSKDPAAIEQIVRDAQAVLHEASSGQAP